MMTSEQIDVLPGWLVFFFECIINHLLKMVNGERNMTNKSNENQTIKTMNIEH